MFCGFALTATLKPTANHSAPWRFHGNRAPIAPQMSTRRERIEARLARRRQWRESALAASNAAASQATSMLSMIPAGQPILVGHHSEKRHRSHLARMDSAMGQACERDRMAKRHDSVAASLAHQLDRSIFSDDANATDALQERADDRTAEADWCVTVNKAWRKAKKPDLRYADKLAEFCTANGYTEDQARKIAFAMRHRWEAEPQPFPAYHVTGLRAAARRDKERKETVAVQQERAAAAQAAAGGVVVTRATGADFCRVTFAEKPSRVVLDELREAGFWWRGGSWSGTTSKLPASVVAMESA